MNGNYPTSFERLRQWAKQAGLADSEARDRFAQYAVLRGIAAVPRLKQVLVFKGGNALDFVWQPNRSTVDLDFSLDPTSDLLNPDADTLRRLLDRGFSVASTRIGVVLAIHSLRPDPPGPDRDFVTYRTRVGYALPDESRLRQRMAAGNPSPNVVEIDISLNEPICDARLVTVDPTLQMRVATIEDIVAEKLRALLQQPIRNRRRRQDLLDIAVLLRERAELDPGRVAVFLLEKSAARDVPVSRSAFHHPEVANRAAVDYDALAATTRRLFVPFDQALGLLYAFVAELPIPD